ncbi:hypothetical protein PMPD1_1757 [Paramixta manurensis]|uniref:Lipoprotein n=1 Tax=Paramixta manurensis TaxID=2740817 RepID=A0A6M8UDX6_9GAMM|nr:hypothetical protein PMPD1_1757 [Erwiniaceae bacterium PD-1]
MKKISVIALVVIVSALAGCARTAPVLNVKHPITQHYSDNQVKTAILEAGLARHWVMTPTAPGVITGRLTQREHSATIRVDYSATQYNITYVNSENLLAGHGDIHRNYNRWINNLDQDIQLRLSAQNLK